MLRGSPERNAGPIGPSCASSKAVNQKVLLGKLVTEVQVI